MTRILLTFLLAAGAATLTLGCGDIDAPIGEETFDSGMPEPEPPPGGEYCDPYGPEAPPECECDPEEMNEGGAYEEAHHPCWTY